jgi:hypothetical protein
MSTATATAIAPAMAETNNTKVNTAKAATTGTQTSVVFVNFRQQISAAVSAHMCKVLGNSMSGAVNREKERIRVASAHIVSHLATARSAYLRSGCDASNRDVKFYVAFAHAWATEYGLDITVDVSAVYALERQFDRAFGDTLCVALPVKKVKK